MSQSIQRKSERKIERKTSTEGAILAAVLVAAMALAACSTFSSSSSTNQGAMVLTMTSISPPSPSYRATPGDLETGGSAVAKSSGTRQAAPEGGRAQPPAEVATGGISMEEEKVLPCHELDIALENLASRLAGVLVDQGAEKIAVPDFFSQEGRPDRFGRYLSAELSSRLFLTGRFFIVDRSRVETALAKDRKDGGAKVPPCDDGSLARLCRSLGADALFAGRYEDAGTEVRARGRLVVPSGKGSLPVTGERIQKDSRVLALLTGETGGEAVAQEVLPEQVPPRPSGVFSKESSRESVRRQVDRVREFVNGYKTMKAAEAALAALATPGFEAYATAEDFGWISFALTEATWERYGRMTPWAEDKYAQSLNLAEKAMELDGGDPMALCALGQVLFREGRLNEARPRLEKALKGDPECTRIPKQFRRTFIGLLKPLPDRAGRPAD